MKIISPAIFLALFSFGGLSAQQPSPIGMIFNPRVNTFAISGVGGGNMYEFTLANSSTSGQVTFDWNLALKDRQTKKGNDKFTTLLTLFKYNPFLKKNYISGDSLGLEKLAFIDNEFQFFLGLRVITVSESGQDKNARFMRSWFFDASTVNFNLKSSISPLNTGFRNFNLNAGFQIGYINNTDFGKVGVNISPQINYIYIYENRNGGKSLEELVLSSSNFSRNILGGGVKLNIPLNDFNIFFEGRSYFPLDNSTPIPGLTERVIFSIGGIATGNVFKSRTKEEKD
ncbi:MAG: hypothetical protein IM638_17780 [Bacteroidetes bacterium]|nr:hypothetical protein [Bacteroidota bacterium]